VRISHLRGVRVAFLLGKEMVMANQKNQGGRQQKQNKGPAEQPMRDPMRKPEEGGEDIERDRSSRRNRDEKSDVDSGSVISNEEEVELDEDDLEEDEESNRVTGRHPSQRDRDLK
jgi:hypothetical protein